MILNGRFWIDCSNCYDGQGPFKNGMHDALEVGGYRHAHEPEDPGDVCHSYKYTYGVGIEDQSLWELLMYVSGWTFQKRTKLAYVHKECECSKENCDYQNKKYF